MTESNTDHAINQLGSMISLHFGIEKVTDFTSASAANNELFRKFFHAMLRRGVYLPPSAFETWFVSNALTYQDIDQTIASVKQSLEEIG